MTGDEAVAVILDEYPRHPMPTGRVESVWEGVFEAEE
jgi:hypothetical protein